MVQKVVGKLLSVSLFLEIKTKITNIGKSPGIKTMAAKNQAQFEVHTAVSVKIYDLPACDTV
jgi:hypothetical protein